MLDIEERTPFAEFVYKQYRRQNGLATTSSSTTSSSTTSSPSATSAKTTSVTTGGTTSTTTTSTTASVTGSSTSSSTTTSSSSTTTSSSSTRSTTTTTSSTVSSTSLTSSTTSTSVTTLIVTSMPPTNFSVPSPSSSSSSVASGNDLASKGFFHNTAAVAGTFSVVGLIALAVGIVLLTTCVRRRRAKRFDDDVAEAAAAAYRDADGRWDDAWDDAAGKGYPTAYSSNTSDTYGAYGQAPMSVSSGHGQNYNDVAYQSYDPSGAAAYRPGVGEIYGMNNLPPTRSMNQSPPPINGPIPNPRSPPPRMRSQSPPQQFYGQNQDPFGDAAMAEAAGAGAGAAYMHNANQAPRYRPPPPQQQQEAPQDYGMNNHVDGSRYPIRSQSMKSNLGRSASGSSSGHGHVGVNRGKSPYIGGGNGGIQESGEDAYEGMGGYSDDLHDHDAHYGEVEDAPRPLRVANA